jgi:hypothetical protein
MLAGSDSAKANTSAEYGSMLHQKMTCFILADVKHGAEAATAKNGLPPRKINYLYPGTENADYVFVS